MNIFIAVPESHKEVRMMSPTKCHFGLSLEAHVYPFDDRKKEEETVSNVGNFR